MIASGLSYPGRNFYARPEGRRVPQGQSRRGKYFGQVGSGNIYPPVMALTLDQGTVREGWFSEVHDPPSLPKLTSHTGPFVNNPRKKFLIDSANEIKALLETEVQSIGKVRDQSGRTSLGQG